MKESTSNKIIALTTVAAAILMAAALSFAIGKWNFGDTGYKITIKFPNASGITPNSEVKYAGAHAGRVVAVHFIPRDQQDVDPHTSLYNCIAVVVEIDNKLQFGDDVEALIKQDGFGISPKYVLLTPGSNPNSPLLAAGTTIQGAPPFDLSDLIQPAGEALMQAKVLINQLGPVLKRLDTMSSKLEVDLPPLVANANKFLIDGDSFVANFNTPESRARLNQIFDSLRVSTENLKVVSSNAKALTATLAEKPWRVFWGGPTVTPPPEAEVLDSNHVIRLKQKVDVNGGTK